MVRAMPNTDVRRLKHTLERVENERDRLDKLAEHFRVVIAYYEEEFIDQPPPLTPAQEMDNAMERIFESARSYMHPKIVLDRLTELGITVPGENPINNTRSHLSLDDRFEPVGNGLWGLSKWDGTNLQLMEDAETSSHTASRQASNEHAQPVLHYITDVTGQTFSIMLEELVQEQEG